MKQLKYNIALWLCFTAVFFFSCDSDDDPIDQTYKPTIKFEKAGDEPVITYPGTELNFSVTLKATAGIKKVVTMLETQEIPGSAKEYPANTEEGTYAVAYTVKAEEVGKTLNFVMVAYDSEEKKSTAEFTVYIQAAKPDVNIEIPGTAPESVIAGEQIAFDIHITSAADLKSIKTFLGDSELTDLRKETFAEPKTDVYSFTYASTDLDAGQTLTFIIEVMDANGGIVRSEYKVDITRPVELDIQEYYELLIGAQTSTAAGPFLNTATGEVYERAGSTAKSADIDITLFYSNGSYGYYFVAPSDASIEAIFKTPDPLTGWPQRNDTKMKVINISSEEFLAVNSTEMIKNLYDASTGPEVGKLTAKLAVGMVVGFRTVKDKYGIMIVRSHASGNAKGSVTIDMKVQK